MRIQLLSLFLLLAPLPVFSQTISIGPNGVRVGEGEHSPEWYRHHGYHWYNDRWYAPEEWEGMRGNRAHSNEWYREHNYHWANDRWYSEEDWREWHRRHHYHDNDDYPN